MQKNGIYLNLWCFKDLVGKAVLFQISPIRLICVVIQADVTNIVKVECLGCHSITHCDDFTSKVTMH